MFFFFFNPYLGSVQSEYRELLSQKEKSVCSVDSLCETEASDQSQTLSPQELLNGKPIYLLIFSLGIQTRLRLKTQMISA